MQFEYIPADVIEKTRKLEMIQRKMERDIRMEKEKTALYMIVYKQSGNESVHKQEIAFRKNATAMRKQLESFCRANGLVYYPDRIKIMEGEDIYLRTKGKYDSIAKSVRAQNSQNVLTSGGKNGIIKTGSKITEKNYLKVTQYEEQANKFYSKMLESDEDIIKISKNINMDLEDLRKVKNHMMLNEIRFKDGSIRKFDADIDQALAWKRLMEGKNIQPTDELLLKHELLEYKIIKSKNLAYEDAHAMANEQYNWEDAVKQIIDEDELFD